MKELCVKTSRWYGSWKLGSLIVIALALMFIGAFGRHIPAKAGTYGMFEFSMDSKTNEISITGLNESGAQATDIVIPAQINGYPVTWIGGFADNENIVSVSFEQGCSLKSIGSGAFSSCTNLQSIVLPSTVSRLGDSCFYGCTSLQSIALPASVRELGSECFFECRALSLISLPEGLTEISSYAFANCRALNSITLPSTVTAIRSYAFAGCHLLREINLSPNLTGIEDHAFYYSGLLSIVIPDSVTRIGYYTFRGSDLETVTLSKNIKKIPYQCFEGCTALKKISIPVDLEEIDSEAFSGCSELETITLGDALTKIRDKAFSDCPKLVVRVVRGTIAESYCMNNNIPYVVYASSIGACTIDGIVEKTYTGSAQTQNLTVRLGTILLTQNTDYTVAYSYNVDVGTVTITITGIGNYIGNIQKTFSITSASIEKAKIKVKSKVKYNAKYQTPNVDVILNGKALPATAYTVSYYRNIYVGTATVTVSGKGNYTGTIKSTFNIVPKGTKIKSVSGVKKGFKVSYKENHIQTTGYQVQYATDTKFKKNCKTSTVKNNKKKSKTVTGLKSKKTYYVRVRTYALVGGKKIYSSWTPAKTVRTR